MCDQVKNNQLRFRMSMIGKRFLFFCENRVGMGDDFAIIQLMGMEKQNPIGNHAQYQHQAKMTEKGYYFSKVVQFLIGTFEIEIKSNKECFVNSTF